MDVKIQYPKDLDHVCTNNVRRAKSSELRDGIVKCSEVQSWRQELGLGKERSFSKLYKPVRAVITSMPPRQPTQSWRRYAFFSQSTFVRYCIFVGTVIVIKATYRSVIRTTLQGQGVCHDVVI